MLTYSRHGLIKDIEGLNSLDVYLVKEQRLVFLAVNPVSGRCTASFVLLSHKLDFVVH